jgi:hypothetical protein
MIHLPSKVYATLIDDASWEQLQHSSMQKFLDEYTLHDSDFLGIDYSLDGRGHYLYIWIAYGLMLI